MNRNNVGNARRFPALKRTQFTFDGTRPRADFDSGWLANLNMVYLWSQNEQGSVSNIPSNKFQLKSFSRVPPSHLRDPRDPLHASLPSHSRTRCSQSSVYAFFFFTSPSSFLPGPLLHVRDSACRIQELACLQRCCERVSWEALISSCSYSSIRILLPPPTSLSPSFTGHHSNALDLLRRVWRLKTRRDTRRPSVGPTES